MLFSGTHFNLVFFSPTEIPTSVTSATLIVHSTWPKQANLFAASSLLTLFSLDLCNKSLIIFADCHCQSPCLGGALRLSVLLCHLPTIEFSSWTLLSSMLQMQPPVQCTWMNNQHQIYTPELSYWFPIIKTFPSQCSFLPHRPKHLPLVHSLTHQHIIYIFLSHHF